MTDKNIFKNLLAVAGLRAEGDVERLLLHEYGAVFAAQNVTPPPFVIFPDEFSVSSYQAGLATASARIGDREFTLQTEAIKALSAAALEAAGAGLSISPRGPESGSRTYSDTVALWASRVEPALDHWQRLGRISEQAANEIRLLSPFAQVPVVLSLERQGIFFAKDLSKSIIYSVAPPGASQHLAMLAFDIAEFDQPEIRLLLARHCWFQTVTSDLPHFTYLGACESELPMLCLKSVENSGRRFWVPDI